MQRRVGIREAKAKLSRYIELARRGDDVVFTDRGTPVVRLVPIPDGDRTEQEVLRGLADLGLVELAEKPAGVHRPIPAAVGVSISALVREMRR
jgi:prevent-host-death family protein